jgi:hypothetical protein
LTKDDLIPCAEYERVRDSFRQRIIALKRRRRISVGEKITLLFENRETIQFQIQEMIRTERIVDDAKVQDELDVYNAQLPGEGELSATLFIEITESERIKEELDAFQGLDRGEKVALEAGPHRIFGGFEGGHSKEDKISAVHFVRFRPTGEFLGELRRRGGPLSVVVAHPNYRARAPVPEAMRQEWLQDLGLAGAALSRPG